MTVAANLPDSLYTALMGELKVRLIWIDHVLDGGSELDGQIASEFCYLQLRFMCELLALASLVAHGDISEAQGAKLQKAYAADKIFNALAALHADFYPRPVIHTCLAPGRHHFEWFGGPYVSKEELISLYQRCGGMLHKGSLKRLLVPGQRSRAEPSEIREATVRLRNLLSTHAIRGFDPSNYSICFMHFGSDKPAEFVRASSGA